MPDLHVLERDGTWRPLQPLPAPRVAFVPRLADVPAALVSRARAGDLVLTLGAGDITEVGPRVLALLSAVWGASYLLIAEAIEEWLKIVAPPKESDPIGHLSVTYSHPAWIVRALRDAGTPIGMCGLIKRDTLPDPDLGFALLDEWNSVLIVVAAIFDHVSHFKELSG